jgi:hypothetical protein
MNRPSAKGPAMSRVSRHHLLGSCAVALSIGATAYSPQSAAQVFPNQALQGTYTVTTGAIDAARTSQTTVADKIVVTSAQTVLDWIPSDGNTTGTIEFLKPNTSAMFVGPADFIVLNRVIPTDTNRAIAINGNVSSTIDPGVSAPGNGPIGGSVWFYSPGGIVIGGTGSFNVGNLVLSTAELKNGANGLFASGNTIRFGTTGLASPAGSGVTIMNGANIQLNNPGSYLAIVAPIIVQGGRVNVNGSVAYVAAEQANISINAGLFNINFVAGTTATNAITHTETGITTGPGQTGNGNITFAAISKNNAITSLLLSGSIGYTPAASASIQNGQVVLLGGYSDPAASTPVGSGATNIQLGGSLLGTNFTSSVTAKSNGAILGLSGSASTPLAFSSNVTLLGNTSAQLSATNGGALTVGGNLSLTSVSINGATGGNASLSADWLGGTAASVTVNGTTTLDTSGIGLLPQTGVGGTGLGGTSSILVNGSTMTLIGDTRLIANGTGGGSNVTGGIGQGGTASVVVQNTTGAGFRASTLSLAANGTGGEYGFGAPTGGAGTGGTASFLADNAGVFGTSLTVTANGYGGYGGGAGIGGTGKGGAIGFQVSGETSFVQFDGVSLKAEGASLLESVDESVAFSGNGGRGEGGTINIRLLGGTTRIGGGTGPNPGAGTFEVSANGRGSEAFSSGNSPGRSAGAGTGGIINFRLDGGAFTASTMYLHASGYGGSVTRFGDFATVGGVGTGGTVTVDAPSGNFTGALQLEAIGTGGDGGNAGLADGSILSGAGGAGVGGTVGITARGATFNTSNLTALTLSKGGRGGSAGTGTVTLGGSGGDGGRASGGNATIAITGGNSTFNLITADTTAKGGDGGVSQTGTGAFNVLASKGGAAIAGNVVVNITGGISQISTVLATAIANAGGSGYSSIDQGGTATTFAGGDAMGGTVAVNIASTVNGLNAVALSAEGRGGYGAYFGAAGAGGLGTGGAAGLTVSATNLSVNSITISTAAYGGVGGNSTQGASANGGSARGGNANFELAGNALLSFISDTPQFNIDASGNGGRAQSAGEGFNGGRGGDGVGGSITVLANQSKLDLSTVPLALDAGGFGGLGGRGGDGGRPSGSTIGGAGGNGGNAVGGNLTLRSSGANAQLIFGASGFGYAVTAIGGGGGTGGKGGFGASGTTGIAGAPGGVGGNGTNGLVGLNGGIGGVGGIGTAGTLTIEASNLGVVSAGTMALAADGFGGNGGLGGFGGDGGRGGNGGSGGAGGFNQNGGAGGNGGLGGRGGDAGGNGNAGYGAGGNIVISANGGSIVTGDLTTSAIGRSGFANVPTPDGYTGSRGGSGGSGGSGGAGGAPGVASGVQPIAGVTGSIGSGGPSGLDTSIFGVPSRNSAGGTIAFITSTVGNAPGRMNLGLVSATVDAITNQSVGPEYNGNFGTISFRSLGPRNAGQTMQFAGLVANAGTVDGADASGAISFALNNPLSVAGNVALTSSGTVNVNAVGAGSLLANGSVTINAGTTIGVDHQNPLIGTGAPSFVTIGGSFLQFQSGGRGRGNGATTINGVVTGTTISFRSTDIVITPNTTIGTAGATTQVVFTNTSTSATTIGGSGAASGYVLDNTELQRVRSNNLSVLAPLPRSGASTGTQAPASVNLNAPDVIIDTLNLSGGAGGAFSGGTFRVQSVGKLRLVGPVVLTDLNGSNRFEIVANNAIEALPTSSVTMTATGGSLAGTLALRSDDIIAGSTSALSDIAAASDLTAASNRIGTNDSPSARDNGYFAAGAIIATVGNSIYIQNTGAATTAAGIDYAARRGFTVGSGGLTIVQSGRAPVKIAINGRQLMFSPTTGAATGFYTGADLIPRVSILGLASSAGTQTPGIFDPLSTVNGCMITAASACVNTPVVLPDPGTSIARDTIQNAATQFATSAQLLPVALVQFPDFKGFIGQPLIDEPVTGAGNDDLYSLDDAKRCNPDQNKPCK